MAGITGPAHSGRKSTGYDDSAWSVGTTKGFCGSVAHSMEWLVYETEVPTGWLLHVRLFEYCQGLRGALRLLPDLSEIQRDHLVSAEDPIIGFIFSFCATTNGTMTGSSWKPYLSLRCTPSLTLQGLLATGPDGRQQCLWKQWSAQLTTLCKITSAV